MFFLTRAAVCIGLVAAAASAAGGGELATTLDHGARDAATQLGGACLASRRCMALGTGLVAAALPTADADASPPRFRPPRRADRAEAPAAREPEAGPPAPVPPERPARRRRHDAPPRA